MKYTLIFLLSFFAVYFAWSAITCTGAACYPVDDGKGCRFDPGACRIDDGSGACFDMINSSGLSIYVPGLDKSDHFDHFYNNLPPGLSKSVCP